MIRWVFLVCVVLLVGVSQCRVAAQDQSCDDTDVDPAELAENDIGFTADLDFVEEEEVRKQLAVDINSERELQAMVDANEAYRNRTNLGLETVEYSTSVQNTFNLDLVYLRKCPVRWYWMKTTIFYFKISTDEKKYCWPYYPLLVGTCQRNYCYNHWYERSTDVKFPIYWRYRCYPYYSLVWFRARCLTFVNSQPIWSSQYLVRRLPRGCDCKKSFFIPKNFAEKQCPADQ